MHTATHREREELTSTRVLGDLADKSTAVEHGWVVVDVAKYHSHLSIASQRRLYGPADAVDRLVVREHVEVPDGATSRRVAVQCAGDEHLASVSVDDERSIVSELTSHRVTDSGLAIHIRISRANLNITNYTGGLSNRPASFIWPGIAGGSITVSQRVRH